MNGMGESCYTILFGLDVPRRGILEVTGLGDLSIYGTIAIEQILLAKSRRFDGGGA